MYVWSCCCKGFVEPYRDLLELICEEFLHTKAPTIAMYAWLTLATCYVRWLHEHLCKCPPMSKVRSVCGCGVAMESKSG